jgi:hypothetical protein
LLMGLTPVVRQVRVPLDPGSPPHGGVGGRKKMKTACNVEAQSLSNEQA